MNIDVAAERQKALVVQGLGYGMAGQAKEYRPEAAPRALLAGL